MRTASIRHQLVTSDQRVVFDYWLELFEAARDLPHRESLDLSRLARQLPLISLYQTNAKGRFDVRLAGTGFWNFFATEISGRAVDDLPLGDGCAYWHRVLSHVAVTGEPLVGSTLPQTPKGAGLSQFWLRLPLRDDHGPLILGFDQFLTREDRSPSHLMQNSFAADAPSLAIA